MSDVAKRCHDGEGITTSEGSGIASRGFEVFVYRVKQKGKIGVLDDCSWEGQREENGQSYRLAVNAPTDFNKVPECLMAEVTTQIVKRIFGLRA